MNTNIHNAFKIRIHRNNPVNPVKEFISKVKKN